MQPEEACKDSEKLGPLALMGENQIEFSDPGFSLAKSGVGIQKMNQHVEDVSSLPSFLPLSPTSLSSLLSPSHVKINFWKQKIYNYQNNKENVWLISYFLLTFILIGQNIINR